MSELPQDVDMEDAGVGNESSVGVRETGPEEAPSFDELRSTSHESGTELELESHPETMDVDKSSASAIELELPEAGGLSSAAPVIESAQSDDIGGPLENVSDDEGHGQSGEQYYNDGNSSNAVATEETLKLIDMLRSDEVTDRIAAMGQLDAVASALGPVRTRDELIPFLTESIDDEDEVLLVMAEAMGRMVPYVGGQAEAQVLLPPLELLLTVEENSVREKAVESTKAVAKILNDQAYRTKYYDMLTRLAAKEWFTARISAGDLIVSSFGRSTQDQQEDLMKAFANLCRDETPMVRRVASANLGTLLTNAVSTLGPSSITKADGVVTSVLLPLNEELARNDQDAVRLQITENCISFGRALSIYSGKSLEAGDGDSSAIPVAQLTDLTRKILPLLVGTIDDKSWRVRWTAASKFADVVVAFSTLPSALEILIPAYEKLLQDPEAEVRTAATMNLSEVAKCNDVRSLRLASSTTEGSGQDVTMDGADDGTRVTVPERLAKRVAALTDDESEHVRAALAMVATELAPVLGKDGTITHLLPPLLLLLRDPSSEVRLNLISSLRPLNDVIGIELLSQSLLPAIVDLAEDNKWRIRLAIIKHIPLLAKQLGEAFFSEKLASLCVSWIGDDISSIRQAAASNLMELVDLFGSKWALMFLVPPVVEMQQNQSYLRRVTVVQACAQMATKMDEGSSKNGLLPIVLELASDSVPNIRFNVAKALEMMAPVCGMQAYSSTIRPVLSVLVEDPDRDVRYFALKTLESLEGIFKEKASLS